MQRKTKSFETREGLILPSIDDNVGYLSDLITEWHNDQDPQSSELEEVNPEKLVGKLIISVDRFGKRQVERVQNALADEIETEKLKSQLNRIAKQLKVPIDEVCDEYVAVSGDMEDLKKALRGEDVMKWTDDDDEALYMAENSKAFQKLLKERGAEELKIRKEFLELHNYF